MTPTRASTTTSTSGGFIKSAAEEAALLRKVAALHAERLGHLVKTWTTPHLADVLQVMKPKLH